MAYMRGAAHAAAMAVAYSCRAAADGALRRSPDRTGPRPLHTCVHVCSVWQAKQHVWPDDLRINAADCMGTCNPKSETLVAGCRPNAAAWLGFTYGEVAVL